MGSCCTDTVNYYDKQSKQSDEKDKHLISESDLEKMKSRKFKYNSSISIY
jgi:hypothetical protein